MNDINLRPRLVGNQLDKADHLFVVKRADKYAAIEKRGQIPTNLAQGLSKVVKRPPLAHGRFVVNLPNSANQLIAKRNNAQLHARLFRFADLRPDSAVDLVRTPMPIGGHRKNGLIVPLPCIGEHGRMVVDALRECEDVHGQAAGFQLADELPRVCEKLIRIGIQPCDSQEAAPGLKQLALALDKWCSA